MCPNHEIKGLWNSLGVLSRIFLVANIKGFTVFLVPYFSWQPFWWPSWIFIIDSIWCYKWIPWPLKRIKRHFKQHCSCYIKEYISIYVHGSHLGSHLGFHIFPGLWFSGNFSKLISRWQWCINDVLRILSDLLKNMSIYWQDLVHFLVFYSSGRPSWILQLSASAGTRNFLYDMWET